MIKDEILQNLRADEKKGKGEILNITEEGVEYFDYEYSWDDHTIFFRDEKYCTEKKLKDIIYISEHSKRFGITKEYIASILRDAYTDCFIEMMTTLRSIAIIHTEEDLKELFQFANVSSYDEVNIENCVGITVFDCQICIIYEGEILRMCSELNDSYSGINIYESGIGITLIHECRHQMLDCNFLLSEGDFPIVLSSEDEVEEFSRFKWDSIYSNHHLESDFLQELNEL